MSQNKIPPLIQSVLSNYIAKRDKSLAELDICFNQSPTLSINETLTEKVSSLFKDLHQANGILETIETTLNLNDVQEKTNKK